MSSCSLVIVHASLKKHGFEKNVLLIGASESGGRTWRDKKIHDFHNFSNSGLKFYMRISECICNRIMMKKNYRFFDPFTGEASLNAKEETVLCNDALCQHHTIRYAISTTSLPRRNALFIIDYADGVWFGLFVISMRIRLMYWDDVKHILNVSLSLRRQRH